jgi:DNA helicase II / ATP-dependent DNA helicase PcrA
MQFIADLHIHSHYSRATSKDLIPEYLDYYARLKGVRVLGTGDFTHPGWLGELKEKLVPAEEGLYRLKNDLLINSGIELKSGEETRFILSAEISSIYKKNGRVRKVHSLILSPDFDTVEAVQKRLEKSKFNITSDGRPILGLDVKLLLEMLLDISDKIMFIPAHIWTPWFSVLGEKSGFDSIEECFEEMTGHIFAVETGLSSDPPMNYLCSFLDKYRLVSNSDAHSPEKIGRNANIFDTDLTYEAITDALKPGASGFNGTIDMFPQEGKYHYDGHRNCGIVFDPLQTLKNDFICPNCGKRLTVGVMHRVTQLADRSSPEERNDGLPNFYIIPLKEILGEITGSGTGSIAVTNKYDALIKKYGNEFNLLLFIPLDEIKTNGDMAVYEAIKRMREGTITIHEGYDGEYGKISLFETREASDLSGSLFGNIMVPRDTGKSRLAMINFDVHEYHALSKRHVPEKSFGNVYADTPDNEVNDGQSKAVSHFTGPLLIIAGPGTGKTHTLAERIASLVLNRRINPQNILAVTFTNKAGGEMRARLSAKLVGRLMPQVCTFHSFGYSILKKFFFLEGRKEGFAILNDSDRMFIIKNILKTEDARKVLDFIAAKKQDLKPGFSNEQEMSPFFGEYEKYLEQINAFDLDDLIYKPLGIFTNYPDIRREFIKKYEWIFIDEYQDINPVQYKLLRCLCPEPNSNICAIGDPNQAIYGFRGSVGHIGHFLDDYPSAATYILKKSYRCPDRILKAGDDVIDAVNSLNGAGKGVKINMSSHPSSKSEAEFIARTIEDMMGGLSFFSMDSGVTRGNDDKYNASLSDFVILCRIKEQFKDIEKALTDHRIPYGKFSETVLQESNVMSLVADLIKQACNPSDKFLKLKLEKIHGISEFLDPPNTAAVKDILSSIRDKYLRHVSDNDSNYYLDRLNDISPGFGNDIKSFLDFITTGTEPDVIDMKSENVKLMTIHASKGLEFETVFIPGCEEGIIPFSLFNENTDIEEEKRILYVGITRTRKNLFISNAAKRMLYGKEWSLKRSAFVDKIGRDLYMIQKNDYERKNDIQPDLF